MEVGDVWFRQHGVTAYKDRNAMRALWENFSIMKDLEQSQRSSDTVPFDNSMVFLKSVL